MYNRRERERSDLRHLVMRRKGSTRTRNIGMKAMISSMTTMRANRAMMRARGKRANGVRIKLNRARQEKIRPAEICVSYMIGARFGCAI